MSRKKNRNRPPMETALAAVATATPTPANDATAIEEVGQTTTAESPTMEQGESASSATGQTTTAESPTVEVKVNKGGRTKREDPEPVKWTIRGVDRETRNVIEKASERSDKTLGEYFNSEIRALIQEQIKKGSLPPMSPTDIRDQLKSDVEAMELRIAATTKDQLAQLRQDLLTARTAPEQRKGILARLFG
jgi:hypothetical protein